MPEVVMVSMILLCEKIKKVIGTDIRINPTALAAPARAIPPRTI